MHKDDIGALFRAHKCRAHPVAFLHILRQARLDHDDCAFLFEHIRELESVDLVRFHARCPPEANAPIFDELARRAQMDPQRFRYELLDPLRASMSEREWVELADHLSGQVPPDLWECVLRRSHADSSSPPLSQHNIFIENSDKIADLSALGFFDDDDDLLSNLNGASPGADAALLQALKAAESTQSGPVSQRRATLANVKDQLTMSQLCELHKSAPQFLSEGTLQTIAMERAKRPDQDWSPHIAAFPPVLRGAVLERLRQTRNSPERIMLLEWLEKTGTARKDALRIALSSLRSPNVPQPLIAWFARQLQSHNAWKTAGKTLLGIFIQQRAFSEMIELATISFNTTPGEQGAPANSHPLVESVAGAYISAFLTAARVALESGQAQTALAALSALLCLDLQPKLVRPLRALRRSTPLPDALALLKYAERKAQGSPPQTPSLESIVAAVHAFSDAVSD